MDKDVLLRRGLRRSVAAFLFVIVALPLISLWTTYEIRDLSGRIVEAGNARLMITRALRDVAEEETGVQGYLATGERQFLTPYRNAQPNFKELERALPAAFTRAGLDEAGAGPDLQDFLHSHAVFEATVLEPLLRNPTGPRAVAQERAGVVWMNRMRRDVRMIHVKAEGVATAAAQRMYDVTVAATALGVLWILIVAVFAMVLDRRALKRENDLVESLVREREEVERLSEWRSRLLAMLAHDFKSQLTVLIGAAHLLEDFPQRRGDPELLASLRSAGYTLAEMADNAILLARAQERKLVLYRTPFNVTDVVSNVVQRYGAEREFVVHREIAAAFIDADRSYVTRVIDNIIGNAVKYSQHAVEVFIADDGDMVAVKVSDSGVGISEQDLPHIFEEYWRSERTSWKQKGSGVGLFIVKTIMEAHGGSIEVRSEFGKGTTVTLRFPRAFTLPVPERPPAAV